MTGIADTGFIVAFLNRRDSFHPWAVRRGGQAREAAARADDGEQR